MISLSKSYTLPSTQSPLRRKPDYCYLSNRETSSLYDKGKRSSQKEALDSTAPLNTHTNLQRQGPHRPSGRSEATRPQTSSAHHTTLPCLTWLSLKPCRQCLLPPRNSLLYLQFTAQMDTTPYLPVPTAEGIPGRDSDKHRGIVPEQLSQPNFEKPVHPMLPKFHSR